MRPLRRFFRRLFSWATAQRDEERLRAEIEEHLALQTAEYLRAGLSPAEAQREAALKFGAVEAMKESYRENKGLPFMETLVWDLRLALRRFRMAPAFTFSTMLTLALGIGATTSIFTLAHAVLLKSLPVARPDELYRVGKEARCCYLAGYSQDKEFSLVSYDLYKYLRDNTKGFVELAAFPAADLLFGVRRAGNSEAAATYGGEFVSGNYFAMFGIGAYAGRTFTAEDDQAGAPPVAVMSYRLWQGKYGRDPAVIGGTFNVDEKPFTVVGIAPPGFFGDTLRGAPPDFFLPLNTEPYVESEADLNKYGQHWLELIGRVAPGARPASIEAAMRVELKQWLRSHWGEMSAGDRLKFPEQTLFLVPGGAGIASMRERYERWLLILMTVTGFVLLIVCANVANLMLVRGMERRRQTSLSMALGARASRIVRQNFTECMALSLLGGTAGVAIAFLGTRLILHLAFPASSGMAGIPIDASPSLPVLLFAFGVSAIAGVAFGIAPAWAATRTDPIEALRGASRVTARAGSLPRKALVVVQIALSLVLLSASGILTSGLRALETQDFGFEQDRRIVAKINPRLAGYQPSQLSQLYRRIHDSIASVPGVSSVALCLYSPPGGGWGSGVWVDGHAPGPRADNVSMWDRITPGYFGVIGTPIVKGRDVSDGDTGTSQHVAIINEAFARTFFRNEDPIGRHFGRSAQTSREFEVIGVANDARYLTDNPGQPSVPLFFLPEAQADYTKSAGSLFLHDIVILTRPGANLSVAAVRQAMASADPGMPIVSIQTLREKVGLQFIQQRLIARLTSFFGLLSLMLAAIGLYGVIAYNAGRRVSEVGVRVALGATRGDVIRLVLKGAFGLILAGLSIGLPLTFVAGRLLGSQIHGVNPYSPAVTIAAIVALGLAALLASIVPAIRASLISPLDALRSE
ncbi:MAG: ABC transporter permease [Bryobacteraceae bacterium]